MTGSEEVRKSEATPSSFGIPHGLRLLVVME